MYLHSSKIIKSCAETNEGTQANQISYSCLFLGELACWPRAQKARDRPKVFAAAGICLTAVDTAAGGGAEAANWQACLDTRTSWERWSTGTGAGAAGREPAEESAQANHNALQWHQGELHHCHLRAGGTSGIGHSLGPEHSGKAAQRVFADIRLGRVWGAASSAERVLQQQSLCRHQLRPVRVSVVR